MSVGDYTRGFRPAGADAAYINGAPGVTTAASRAAVSAATASDPLLAVSTTADYKSSLASRVNQMLALFGTMLGLAVLIALFGISNTLIALFGISNTLTLSVIERTRESALMRALGSIPFAEIGLFVAIGTVAALAAAVLPARRAARVSVVSAMAEV